LALSAGIVIRGSDIDRRHDVLLAEACSSVTLTLGLMVIGRDGIKKRPGFRTVRTPAAIVMMAKASAAAEGSLGQLDVHT
jgi:hypothetical protein